MMSMILFKLALAVNIFEEDENIITLITSFVNLGV